MMAQHDFYIEDLPGREWRHDVNDALAALASLNSGPTPPPIVFPGELWFDTDRQQVMLRNVTNTDWILVGFAEAGWGRTNRHTIYPALRDLLRISLGAGWLTHDDVADVVRIGAGLRPLKRQVTDRATVSVSTNEAVDTGINLPASAPFAVTIAASTDSSASWFGAASDLPATIVRPPALEADTWQLSAVSGRLAVRSSRASSGVVCTVAS